MDKDGILGGFGVKPSLFANREASDDSCFVTGEESAGFGIFENYFFVCLNGFGFGKFVESTAFSEYETVAADEVIDTTIPTSNVKNLEAGGMDSDKFFARVGLDFIAHIGVGSALSGISAPARSGAFFIIGINATGLGAGTDLAACETVNIGHDVPGGRLVAFSEGFFEGGESSGFLVADGEDDVGYVIELGQFELGSVHDIGVGENFVECVGVIPAEGLNWNDLDSGFNEEFGFVLPVEVIAAVTIAVTNSVGDVVANEDESLVVLGSPGHTSSEIEDEFVAFFGIATVSAGGALDKSADFALVISEVKAGDTIVAVTVVAVGDDANADVGNEVEEFSGGLFNISADLGEAGVHAAGGVEAED